MIMRCLAHIALVTVYSLSPVIWLIGGMPKQFLCCLHSAMAGTVYLVVLSNTKKRDVSDEFKFSKGVWYITMPVLPYSLRY